MYFFVVGQTVDSKIHSSIRAQSLRRSVENKPDSLIIVTIQKFRGEGQNCFYVAALVAPTPRSRFVRFGLANDTDVVIWVKICLVGVTI